MAPASMRSSSDSEGSEIDDPRHHNKYAPPVKRLGSRGLPPPMGAVIDSDEDGSSSDSDSVASSSDDENANGAGSTGSACSTPSETDPKSKADGNSKAATEEKTDATTEKKEQVATDEAAKATTDATHQPAVNDDKPEASNEGNLVNGKRSSKSKKSKDKDLRKRPSKRAEKDKKKKKSTKKAAEIKADPLNPEFFRADQVWDKKTNSFKLKKTKIRSDKDEYGQYIFHVRRCFNPRGELEQIWVDIKSRTLKKLLEVVMGAETTITFAEKQPQIDPDLLFIYLEDLRALAQKLRERSETSEDEKRRTRLTEQAASLECLLQYMDKDYERLKVRLKALLETGNITFDLLSALYRAGDIVYVPTYGNPEEPRAFRVKSTSRTNSRSRGLIFSVDGEYLNYDGKNFGVSTALCDIECFEGTRRITSLPCYPFKYHPTSGETQKQLIERGKKFVNLHGRNYLSHVGLGFMKRGSKLIKVSVNSRVMIDPLVFRRMDPNFPVATVRADDYGTTPDTGLADDEATPDDADFEEYAWEIDQQTISTPVLKLVLDKDSKMHLLPISLDEKGEPVKDEALEKLLAEGGAAKRDFTEEDLLISSPVVLGFAFTQKLWLEFTVSGIRDIEWNEGAFESLVLPESQKSLVKALVTSHASVTEGRGSIDDLIKGKGKGLVAVLHGSPGVGKTLTAEGIADLLRRPLYYVSAGELGTSPQTLEGELTKILEVAQTWGAVLLLDEAEIFLEQRTTQDIHRNALVSIFLRELEYFQGILFLTTNRVTCFDAAFQSRIHFALRYQELDYQARRSVFKMFIERVVGESLEAAKSASAVKGEVEAASKKEDKTATDAGKATGSASESAEATETAVESAEADEATQESTAPAEPSSAPSTFSEADYDRLARRRNINGRQIKNAVRSAQALAHAEGAPMTVAHIVRVLEISETFEQDLKGGAAYGDAMRSYM